MANNRFFSMLIVLFLSTLAMSAQNQGAQTPPSIPDMAAKEADNLTKLLDLEYYQTYLVDSVLQANMQPMMDEMDIVRKSGATNQESYMVVSDKWLDAIDTAFMKILTEDQWKKYMKTTYGKEKKKRDKRMAAREKQMEEREQKNK